MTDLKEKLQKALKEHDEHLRGKRRLDTYVVNRKTGEVKFTPGMELVVDNTKKPDQPKEHA